MTGERIVHGQSAVAAWTGTLEKYFSTHAPEKEIQPGYSSVYSAKWERAPAIKSAKPRVFIPAFPGTNCEIDTARAFEKAGAQPEILVVKNLCAADIEETIERMVKEIEQAQYCDVARRIFGGDEPDGSGKFIATTFRNQSIAEAVTSFWSSVTA